MFQLVESIKCHNGELFNLDYHQKRLNESYRKVFELMDVPYNLSDIPIPKKFKCGVYKFRFIYDQKACTYEWVPYQKKRIKTLKIVEGGKINYEHKSVDRKELSDLFELREQYDDIIIVKEGLITDSFYANLAFHKGSSWFTPTCPLLKGTKRQSLLDQGMLQLADIRKSDLHTYDKVSLINALLDLGDVVVRIDHIF